jgi:short-subunit dehydrogenase
LKKTRKEELMELARRTLIYTIVRGKYDYYFKRDKNKIKNVFITGAANGLGRQLALNFSNDGYNVIGLDIKPKDQLDTNINNSLIDYIEFNLKNIDDIDTMIKQLMIKHKHIDLLINNAGVMNFKALYDYDIEEIKEMVDVNLTSILALIKSILPLMVKQNFGRIINISSKSAFQGEDKFSVYSSTKIALVLLTDSVAKLIKNEHWLNNVTINAIAPDRIDTPEYIKENPGVDPKKLISSKRIYKKIQRIVQSEVNGDTFPIFSLWKRFSFLLQFFRKLFV